jgi:hypothetical protein
MIFATVFLIRSHTRKVKGRNSNRRHSPIQTLSDDVLLNIFHLYRLGDPDEYDDGTGTVFVWHRQHWWYKLAHVCRQWRNIILESPSRLDLHLHCTNGVSVADMLAHSPPLPLTINYHTINREMTTMDESGILLALSHRDRVRHVYFWMLPNVWKFVAAMDQQYQFPILERMHIHSQSEVDLPITFQAPNLRQLRLWRASLPIGSPLLSTTTAAGLVSLSLLNIPASAYFPPSFLLTRLSLMLQLMTLSIGFYPPFPNRDFEGQLHHTSNLNMATLPNLCRFAFTGVSDYLEDLVARISAPSLSFLRVKFFDQLPITVPRLLQFMQTSDGLSFSSVKFAFKEYSVHVTTDPWTAGSSLELQIICDHLDGQVASAVQIFGTLSPILSVVEEVTFSYEEHKQSSELHNDVDRRQWRELLRPFTNAKIICVQDELVGKLSRSLSSANGEPPMELLPNLEKVGYSYSGRRNARDAFAAFLDERQVAGHPVSLRMVDHSMFVDR